LATTAPDLHLQFSPECGSVEDRPQPPRTVQALRLVEDDQPRFDRAPLF
jgi:hypothetical protein